MSNYGSDLVRKVVIKFIMKPEEKKKRHTKKEKGSCVKLWLIDSLCDQFYSTSIFFLFFLQFTAKNIFLFVSGPVFSHYIWDWFHTLLMLHPLVAAV